MKYLYITKKNAFSTDKYLATCDKYEINGNTIKIFNNKDMNVVTFDTFSEISKKESEEIRESFRLPIEEMQNMFKILIILTLAIIVMGAIGILIRGYFN